MCLSPRKPAPPPMPEPLPPPTPSVSNATTKQKAPTEASTDASRDTTVASNYSRKRTGRGSLRIPLSGGSGLNFPTS